MKHEFEFMVQMIVPSKALGDQLFNLLRPFQGDEYYISPFTLPDESGFQGGATALTDGALACQQLATKSFIGLIEEFKGGGYPDALLLHLNKSEVDAIRTQIKVDYYNLYPDGSPRTLRLHYFDDFITASGYRRL